MNRPKTLITPWPLLLGAALLSGTVACSDGATKSPKGDGVATGTQSGTAAPKELIVTWNSYGASVDAFDLYIAKSKTAVPELLSTVTPADDAAFNPASPSNVLDSTTNAVLQTYLGTSPCLTVLAVVDGVASVASNQVCVDLF